MNIEELALSVKPSKSGRLRDAITKTKSLKKLWIASGKGFQNPFTSDGLARLKELRPDVSVETVKLGDCEAGDLGY